MTGRFGKYGELKRRCILRKAKQSEKNGKDNKELHDSDFNMRRKFYDESRRNKR